MNRKFIELSSIILILFMAFGCGKKMTEREIFSEAQKLQSENEFKKSADLYKKLLKEYPESQHYASSLFMLGFLYANDIRDMEKAREYYSEFLRKYPEHELADDVEFELKNLGKSVTDIDKLIQDNEKKEEDKKQ